MRPPHARAFRAVRTPRWREALALVIAPAFTLTIGAASMSAQSAPPASPPSASQPAFLPDAPLTRVLAIGSLTRAWTPEERASIMPKEVRATLQLYLNGKISAWYSRKDAPGVVFLLEVKSVEEANVLLEALPLGVAKLMHFQLIPLGPLTPLSLLAGPPPGGK